jgi:hypothetical protein
LSKIAISHDATLFGDCVVPSSGDLSVLLDGRSICSSTTTAPRRQSILFAASSAAAGWVLKMRSFSDLITSVDCADSEAPDRLVLISPVSSSNCIPQKKKQICSKVATIFIRETTRGSRRLEIVQIAVLRSDIVQCTHLSSFLFPRGPNTARRRQSRNNPMASNLEYYEDEGY